MKQRDRVREAPVTPLYSEFYVVWNWLSISTQNIILQFKLYNIMRVELYMN